MKSPNAVSTALPHERSAVILNTKPKLHVQDKLVNMLFVRHIPGTVTPNQLTTLRVVLTPIVLLLILIDRLDLAMPLFLFAALTDALDGTMARVRNQITDFGKLYDTFADKFLIISTVILVVYKYISHSLSYTIIALEMFFISNALIHMYNGTILHSNVWSKLKFNFQVYGVAFAMLFLIFGTSIFLTISTSAFYLAIAFALVVALNVGI